MNVRTGVVTLSLVSTTPNQTRLQLYLDAEARILRGQSFQLGDRRLQMADLEVVRAEIARLTTVVARESGTGRYSRFSQADFGGST